MTIRFCTPERLNGLKTAFKRVLADLGGVDAAASCSRIGRSQVSDYGNITSDKMPPIDVVLDFEAITGQPHITAAMAGALGYELMPTDTRPAHELAALLSRISLDNGQLLAQAAHVLASKKITSKQRHAMARELTDMVQAGREVLILLEKGHAHETDAV